MLHVLCYYNFKVSILTSKAKTKNYHFNDYKYLQLIRNYRFKKKKNTKENI